MRAWPPTDEVEVHLDFGSDGTIHAGTIARTGEQTFFAYSDALLATGVNPAPFCLPFTTEPFEVPVRSGAPGCMFADAVPDGWTRHLLEARLLEAGYDPADLNPVDRLALVGGNGLGALSFAPSRELETGVPPLSLDDLAATVVHTQGPGDAGLAVARRLAGSLGGMRPKASVWVDADGKASAAPCTDGAPWIVKFPRPGFDPPDAGPIEYAYSIMARAAGLEMTATRLLESSEGPGYFATARFDRLGERRFHYQSLAGLMDLEPLQASSYVALLGLERDLAGTEGPDEQMIRRMVFNVLACNRDDHARNHGFLMDSGGRWVAAPVFDVTFEPLKEHTLVVGGNSASPSEREIVSVIEAVGGDGQVGRTAFREIRDVVGEWPSFAKVAGLSGDTTERIQTALHSLRKGDAAPARLAAMAAARQWGR